MNKMDNYERVTDKNEVQRFLDLVEPIVCKPNQLSLTWLRKNSWIAVPVADTLNPMDAEWIATASSDLGSTLGYAVSLDSNMAVETYRVPLNQESLLNFSAKVSLLNFVLVPADLSFAILLEAGNYFLVAGNKQFVRTAIGCSFSTAQTMFLDYVNDDAWPESVTDLLKNVVDRYYSLL